MLKKRAVTFLVCTVLLVGLFPVIQASALEADPWVKIGLYYGTNAMPSANLQNPTGLAFGYDIGYFDSSTREFYTLFSTEENKLTMLKDKPMWVNESNVYYDVQPSSYKYSIGCYHLEADYSFSSYSDVMSAVQILNANGFKAFPAFTKNGYRLRIGEFLTQEKAVEAVSSTSSATGYNVTIAGGSQTCYTVTITGTDRILFELDTGAPLGIMPRSERTWFKSVRYYGGFEYSRISGNDLTVINVLRLHDYIKGVIPSEVHPAWPVEAQKAQAVAAKCYMVNNLNKHKSQGFDLCNTTDCQVYDGTERATSVSDSVVDSTFGIYVTYNGQIAQTYYHSSSGGYTDDVINIWGTDIPYLKGVEDKYLKVLQPYSFNVTMADITEVLKSKGYTSKTVVDYYVSRYSQYGNAIEVSFVEAGGNVVRLSGDRARTAINSTAKNIRVNSHRYTISNGASFYINGNRVSQSVQSTYAIGGDGKVSQITVDNANLRAITKNGVESVKIQTSGSVYTVSGTGSGHNIGMSQWGAHAMAEAGFTFDEILKFYFTGVEVGYLQ